ncbi:hypothetical protein MCHI_001336 [Candidatus Magnetoovum chiemensis]|nr:hypothetical protein MCHI_001336 [Candidatus Magnetoovum chiemensis]
MILIRLTPTNSASYKNDAHALCHVILWAVQCCSLSASDQSGTSKEYRCFR